MSDMSDNKFLTVMAVFDDKTQKLLGRIQQSIIDKAGEGTQTMGIPFHITLGSYPTVEESAVVDKIKAVAAKASAFPIKLGGFNSFGDSVLYLEPEIPDELKELRAQFECDFANGFEWVPHATLFCGDEVAVKKAKQIVAGIDGEIDASIVAIELGEFFPPRKIVREQLG